MMVNATVLAREAEEALAKAPLGGPEFEGSMPGLAELYLASGRAEEAAVCACRAAWSRDGLDIAAADLWSRCARPGLAADLYRRSASGDAPGSEAFPSLRAAETSMRPREFWLAWLAVTKPPGDYLSLTCARDRLLARMAGAAPASWLGVPPFRAGAAMAKAARRLPEVRREAEAWLYGEGADAATAGLALAAALAVSARCGPVRAAPPGGCQLLKALKVAYAARAASALAATGSVSGAAPLQRPNSLSGEEIYAWDRLREVSRVLEPDEAVNAAAFFSSDAYKEIYATASVTAESAAAALRLVAGSDADPGEKDEAVAVLLDRAAASGQGTLSGVIGLVLGDSRPGPLTCCKILVASSRSGDADAAEKAASGLEEAVSSMGPTEVLAAAAGLAALKRAGMKDRLASLLDAMRPRLTGAGSAAAAAAVVVAGSRDALGGSSLLPAASAAAEKMLLDGRLSRKQAAVLYEAIASGNGRLSADAGADAVLRVLPSLRLPPGPYTTDRYFDLWSLKVFESSLLAVVPPPWELADEAAEADEYLVRKRVNRDWREASSW